MAGIGQGAVLAPQAMGWAGHREGGDQRNLGLNSQILHPLFPNLLELSWHNHAHRTQVVSRLTLSLNLHILPPPFSYSCTQHLERQVGSKT